MDSNSYPYVKSKPNLLQYLDHIQKILAERNVPSDFSTLLCILSNSPNTAKMISEYHNKIDQPTDASTHLVSTSKVDEIFNKIDEVSLEDQANDVYLKLKQLSISKNESQTLDTILYELKQVWRINK